MESNNSGLDVEDNSEELRVRAEDDAIREQLLSLIGISESTDKFSGWLLAAGGGLIALQLNESARASKPASWVMITAMVFALGSLFVGAVVRLMTYNAGHINRIWGASLQDRVEAIRDRYFREFSQLATCLKEMGKPLPRLRDLDKARIDYHLHVIADAAQRRWAVWLVSVVERFSGLFCGSDAHLNALERQWRSIGVAAQLSTAARVWVVIQLLLLIASAGASVLAYALAAV